MKSVTFGKIMAGAMALMLAACGGGGGGSSSASAPAAAVDMTGTWTGTWSSTAFPGSGGSVSASVSQAGSVLSGSITATGTVVGTATGALNGTISGQNINFGFTMSNGAVVNYTGSVNGAGTSASGTYSVPALGDSGTWTMTKSTAGAGNLANGLVAHYPLNGNANDASGNGNNGTINGAVPVADRNGTPNAAYAFDGVAANITVPDSPSLDVTTAFTVAAWVKPNPGYGVEMFGSIEIVSKWGNIGNASYVLATNAQGHILFGTHDGVNSPTLRASQGGTFMVLPVGQWTHIVGVHANGTNYLYVNGQLAGTQAAVDPMVSTVPLVLGVEPTAGNFFNGAIDDVRIYNRALSAAEVAALYAL